MANEQGVVGGAAAGASAGSAFGPYGAAAGAVIGGGLGYLESTTPTTRSGRRVLSTEAQNQLIYNILSSDKGLAALAQGENLSGGFGSSTKSLAAQDLTAKVAGELATVLAGTEDTSKKGKTVICTELAVQGRLPLDLYQHPRAFEHFNSLPLNTRAGYWIWANRLVPLMRKSPRLSALLAPIAIARYKFIVYRNFSVIGWSSVYIAQPICYMIGACLPKAMRKSYGQS